AVVVRPVRNPEPIRTIYAAVRDPSPAQPAVHRLLDALRTTTAPHRAEASAEHGAEHSAEY
ncbi:LysR family transcriptional regulator, partial [Streptomyces sp. NPDC088341]